jgi:hypothetical protein
VIIRARKPTKIRILNAATPGVRILSDDCRRGCPNGSNFGGQTNVEPEVDLSLGVGRPADESGNDDWELVQRGNLNPD